MYMSLHFLSCSGFGLIMMFKIYGTDGLSGCYGKWVDMQSMGGERNAHKRSFLWLVQYRIRDKCPSFCCKDFFVTFFELQDHAYIYLQFGISLCYTYKQQHVTCQAVQMLESQSEPEGVGFVVCQNVWKCIWQYGYKEKPYRLRHHRTGTTNRLWCTFITRWRHFCSEWQWQWHWQWHRWC